MNIDDDKIASVKILSDPSKVILGILQENGPDPISLRNIEKNLERQCELEGVYLMISNFRSVGDCIEQLVREELVHKDAEGYYYNNSENTDGKLLLRQLYDIHRKSRAG